MFKSFRLIMTQIYDGSVASLIEISIQVKLKFIDIR